MARNDAANAKWYVKQTKLLEGVRNGDVTSMHRLLDYVIDGNDVVPGAALGIMLSIERHLQSSGFDIGYAGKVLERILTSPSSERVSPSGDPEVIRPIWNHALRRIDAGYALRVLARPEFQGAGYTPEKILGLAQKCSGIMRLSGYMLSGEINVTRNELVEGPESKEKVPGNVVYSVDFSRGIIKKLDDLAA